MPMNSSTGRQRLWTLALVLLVVPVLVHAPHAVLNLADRNWDFDQHYAWALQFSQGLQAGDPYPRWMPLGHRGLGEPALLYYSPLYYYVVAALHAVLGSVWNAMRAAELLSTLAVGVFSWRLLARWLPPGRALFGAVLCQATPMVFMLFHYFNGLPWAFNAAGLAALLWALPADGRADAPSIATWLRVAVAVTALVLTHIVSALMALICVSAAFVYLALRGSVPWRRVGAWLLSAGLGLALTSFYLVPALASTSLIASDVWTRDYTPYDAFAFPTWTTWKYGMRWFSFQWPVALVYLGMALAAAWLARRKPPPGAAGPQPLALLLAVTFVALFMTSELSFPLWLLPTPLQKVQFPHRFLFICALAAPLALSLSLGRLPWRAQPRGQRAAVIAAAAAALLLTSALAAKIVLRDGKPVVLVDQAAEPYGSYREYTMRTQGVQWRSYVDQGGLAAECRRIGAECQVRRAGPGGFEWTVELDAPAHLRLPVLAFPAWRLQIDARTQPYAIDPPTGLVTAALSPGTHRVQVTWQRLPSERIGSLLSLAALGLFAALLWWQRRSATRPP